MNNLSLLFTGIVTLISISAVTPWQLFQSMCPYIGAQSPQCAFLQQQLLQQPLSQQQQIPPQSTTSPFTSLQLCSPPPTLTPTPPTLTPTPPTLTPTPPTP
jgi:hypothetical protein